MHLIPISGVRCGLLAATIVAALSPSLGTAARTRQKPPEKAAEPALSVPSGPPAKVVILLKDRQGRVRPSRNPVKSAHTGGGNIDVAQPQEDTLVLTMTGVATAGPHPWTDTAAVMDFDLNQHFAIAFVDRQVTRAKLSAEAFLVGVLRGEKHGGIASIEHAALAIALGNRPTKGTLLALDIDRHEIHGKNLAINDRKGPAIVPVLAGDYTLFQTFRITAAHVHGIVGTAACAECAPDPALNPQWISYGDPFAGTNKTDFGFRVILRVEPE
jgi:hypothetical protein